MSDRVTRDMIVKAQERCADMLPPNVTVQVQHGTGRYPYGITFNGSGPISDVGSGQRWYTARDAYDVLHQSADLLRLLGRALDVDVLSQARIPSPTDPD